MQTAYAVPLLVVEVEDALHWASLRRRPVAVHGMVCSNERTARNVCLALLKIHLAFSDFPSEVIDVVAASSSSLQVASPCQQ